MNNFGSRHSTCANITVGGLWRWGGKISEDFYVFVLLYNTKLMNKFKFDIFLNQKPNKKTWTVQILYNIQNHPTFRQVYRLINLVRRRESIAGLSSY